MIKKVCENCRVEFDIHEYRQDTSRFCSEKCESLFHTAKVKCDNCGLEFLKQKSTIRELNFCCFECKSNSTKLKTKISESLKGKPNPGHFKKGEEHLNWKGGTDDGRGRDWQKQRMKALERDSFECQRCGEVADHVHHIIPYKYTQDNSLNNLMSLCARCHIITEKGYSTCAIEGDTVIIKHVPEKVKERFFQISEESFDGKLEFVLKYLIDVHDGIILHGVEHLAAELDVVREQIKELQQLMKKDEEPKRPSRLGPKKKEE